MTNNLYLWVSLKRKLSNKSPFKNAQKITYQSSEIINSVFSLPKCFPHAFWLSLPPLSLSPVLTLILSSIFPLSLHLSPSLITTLSSHTSLYLTQNSFTISICFFCFLLLFLFVFLFPICIFPFIKSKRFIMLHQITCRYTRNLEIITAYSLKRIFKRRFAENDNKNYCNKREYY